jgi:hypothetical protein
MASICLSCKLSIALASIDDYVDAYCRCSLTHELSRKAARQRGIADELRSIDE